MVFIDWSSVAHRLNLDEGALSDRVPLRKVHCQTKWSSLDEPISSSKITQVHIGAILFLNRRLEGNFGFCFAY